MKTKITTRLDAIADHLQGQGLVKEAQQIDIVSNTIENLMRKTAWEAEKNVMYRGNENALRALSADNVKGAVNFLLQPMNFWKNFVKGYGQVRSLKEAYEAYTNALEALRRGADQPAELEEAKKLLTFSNEKLKDAKPKIQQLQMTPGAVPAI